jgi:hypothetical protein
MADRPCLVWSAVLQKVLKDPRAELQRVHRNPFVNTVEQRREVQLWR